MELQFSAQRSPSFGNSPPSPVRGGKIPATATETGRGLDSLASMVDVRLGPRPARAAPCRRWPPHRLAGRAILGAPGGDGAGLSCSSMSSAVHALFVTWQAPESRRIFPIARVMRQSGGE